MEIEITSVRRYGLENLFPAEDDGLRREAEDEHDIAQQPHDFAAPG